MEIRRILFPVDLTGPSSRIVPEIHYMANKFKAELHLLLVTDAMEQYSSFYVPHPSLDRLEIENEERAERLLKGFAQEHFSDYDRLRVTVLRGNPVEQIKKYVEQEQIDLIMMGCHLRHGFEKALFGKSVIEELLGSSEVPVMCIKPAVEVIRHGERGLPSTGRRSARESEIRR